MSLILVAGAKENDRKKGAKENLRSIQEVSEVLLGENEKALVAC